MPEWKKKKLEDAAQEVLSLWFYILHTPFYYILNS